MPEAGARAARERVMQVAEAVPLVDHHVHGALRESPDRAGFESMITEAPRAPSYGTAFDSQIGFAIRRWCAPVLGLEPHVSAGAYWARRTELGDAEVTRRMLGATGVEHYFIESGHQGDAILSPHEMSVASGAAASEIVRLEVLAEQVLGEIDRPGEFLDAITERVRERSRDAVGFKSIMAYRHGFDVPPDRPAPGEVREAVARCDSAQSRERLSDPVLLRLLQWCAIDTGLPLQLHCAYGDPDLDLHRANPVLLMPWLRQVAPSGTPVMLLHNYPYHREAGYLAQVFENVYFDVGLAINYTGVQSEQVVAESLELAPFDKQVYSSDAWGPAELHALGAVLWRRAMGRVVGRWVEDGDWDAGDAVRVIERIARDNARRVYRR